MRAGLAATFSASFFASTTASLAPSTDMGVTYAQSPLQHRGHRHGRGFKIEAEMENLTEITAKHQFHGGAAGRAKGRGFERANRGRT